MHRTRNALFGLLGITAALFVLRVAQRLSLRAALASELTEKTRPMSSVLWDFAVLNFGLAVANLVFAVLYARSVRHTRAASMANAVWVLVLTQLVLGVGMPMLGQGSPDGSRWTLPLALVVVSYWAQLGLFSASVYRLVVDDGPHIYRGYASLLVGLAVVQSLLAWLDGGLSVTPMDLGAAAPSPSPVVTPALEWLWWGLHALGVGVFASFIAGAARRLPRAPRTDVRVFD